MYSTEPCATSTRKLLHIQSLNHPPPTHTSPPPPHLPPHLPPSSSWSSKHTYNHTNLSWHLMSSVSPKTCWHGSTLWESSQWCDSGRYFEHLSAPLLQPACVAGIDQGTPWQAPCDWRTAPSGSCGAAAGWWWNRWTGSLCQWCMDCKTMRPWRTFQWYRNMSRELVKCLHTDMHSHLYTHYMCIQVFTYIPTNMMHASTHTHMHVHACACMRACTHTQMQKEKQATTAEIILVMPEMPSNC